MNPTDGLLNTIGFVACILFLGWTALSNIGTNVLDGKVKKLEERIKRLEDAA